METRTIMQEGVAVIAISGSLDAMTAEAGLAAINQEIGNGHAQLVVNLDEVDFLSSAGMRILLSSLQSARMKGGDLRLAGGSSNIKRTLNFSGFTKIMKTYETTAEAVSSYSS